MLCLSLALLGGVLLHDLAGARMSLDMASAAPATHAQQDDLCPACTQDQTDVIVCDMDCTAPVLSTARPSLAEVLSLPSTLATRSGDVHHAGLDPGSDPFPPRTSFLS